MPTVNVLLAFNDLKKKSSGGGGFSDGGVLCERRTLSAQPVELGPPPGVAWGGFTASGFPTTAPSVQAINFDPAISVGVEEYFVFADGTQKLVGVTQVGVNLSDTDASLNASAVQACSKYLSNGGVLAYPNKLRYKLVLGTGGESPETTLPTQRVLLHFDVQEFDIPKDQEV